MGKKFTQDFSVVRGLQKSTKRLLRGFGYRFEEHGDGPERFVIWRKKLRPKGKRFVMVPGLGDTPLSWTPTFLQMQARSALPFAEICFLEFPGYLGSHPYRRCFASADHLAQAVLSTLDHLRPHTLMGHSFGGAITAAYSAHKGVQGPERLVLVCPSGLGLEDADRALWEGQIQQIISARTPEDAMDFALKAVGSDSRAYRWIIRELSHFLSREDARALLASFGDNLLLDDRLRDIHARTWVVWGKDDKLMPARWGKEWQTRFEGEARGVPFRLIEVEKAGHFIQRDRPVLIANLLRDIFHESR